MKRLVASRWGVSAAIAASTLIGACQAQAPGSKAAGVPHQVLHAGGQCGTSNTSVQRVADAGALRQLMQGHSLGAHTLAPVVDFDRSLVLHISMGQQPSPGYGMGVTGVRLEAGAHRLVIDTTWTQPEPGRMYAAMVTHPCVLVAVPRGDYRSVAVVDGQGRARASTPLAASR